MAANAEHSLAFDSAALATADSPPVALARSRQIAIDALRGIVMLFMLLDHVRETFYLHAQVSDPMDVLTVGPDLFVGRLFSHLCAPAFVALTGLSAYLFGQTHSKRETSLFLLKRGLFLIVLELTIVGFAWTAQFPPQTFWLQVIWAIGISMVALAGLLHLPRAAQLAVGLLIVAGHNLLDPIVLTADSPWFAPWAIVHQRALIDLGGGLVAKTTYPVLPWIGVILLGYAVGPWFGRATEPAQRSRRMVLLGVSMLALFVLLRTLNVYGDKPWIATGDALRTVMSFVNLTKYPPSLLFLLATLGIGSLLLVLFERHQAARTVERIAILGGAPMYFYLLHLYVLKALYLVAVAIWGTNHGAYLGFDTYTPVWLVALLLVVPLYLPSRWFAQLKQRRKDLAWLRYF